jgi:hypothetical protein
MSRRSAASRITGCLAVALLLALLAPSGASAATCAPQLDGQWTGQVLAPSTQPTDVVVDVRFGESTPTGTITILSASIPAVTVPIAGMVTCNDISFNTPVSSTDNTTYFVGQLATDGSSASGEFVTFSPSGTLLITGVWSLNFTTSAPPAVSVGGARVQEGNSGTRFVEIPVTLSRPATSTVKVNYATSGLTALPDDYVPKTGSLTFAPGGNGLTPTTKWIKVTILGDVVAELDKAFGITLSNPLGATINNAGAAVYIEDDDGTAGPVVSIAGTSVYEGDEGKRDLRLTIWLSEPSTVPVTVEYSTGDGSAAAPADYRPKSDEFTFKPGQVRKAITIKVVPDYPAEGGFEEFYGYLLNAIGAPIDRDTATFTIFDE